MSRHVFPRILLVLVIILVSIFLLAAKDAMVAYELQPIENSYKAVDHQVVHRNETVSYTIKLDNPGTVDLTNVQLIDILPNHLLYLDGSLAASKGQAIYNNGEISWSGTITAQQPVTVTFKALVDGVAPLNQSITNTAEIHGGGLVLYRNATVSVEPYRVYCPMIIRPCIPMYSDIFNDPASGWPIADDGKKLYEYFNGEYRILVRPAHTPAAARPDFQASDYSVGVDVRNQNGVMGSYGIAFGIAQDWSTYYSLEIFPDGWFGIYRYEPNNVVTLAEAFSSAILQGTATNHIKVERNGVSIYAYANGNLLSGVTDGTYTGLRYMGLLAYSYDQPNVDIRFDNFTVYSIYCKSLNNSEIMPAELNPLPVLSNFTGIRFK